MENLREITFASLDLETTGLFPACGHRLCEVGIVYGKLGQEPKLFSSLVNPKHPCDRRAHEVHGLDDELLSDAPEFHEIAEEVKTIIDGAVIVGHNVQFDLKFLAKEWHLLNWPPQNNLAIDTLALARLWLNLPSNRLSAVAQHLDIINHAEHQALSDAATVWNIFHRFLNEIIKADLSTFDDLNFAQGGEITWPTESKIKVPPLISEALKNDNYIHLLYKDGQGEITDRWVEPVDFYGGYLSGFCHLRGENRNFRLDRIIQMKASDKFPASLEKSLQVPV